MFSYENKETVVQYLIQCEQVPEDIAKTRVEEFMQVEETRKAMCDLIAMGRFKKTRKKFLNFVNAYELTQSPYEMSNFMALCTLYDMVTKGPECAAFKSVVVSTLTAAEYKDNAAKKLEQVLADWRPPLKEG